MLRQYLAGSPHPPGHHTPCKTPGKTLPGHRTLPAAARRRALKATAVYGLLPAFGRNVGRAISPAAGPCGTAVRCGARPCRTLRGISTANRQCTPQSAPCGASSSPCRGAFQAAGASKAGKTNTARNTAVPGCIVFYRDPGQGVLIRKSLRQTADGTSPPMGGNLAPRRRTLPAQIVLEGRCVKFNHLRAVKKQWITGGCACAGQPNRRQRRPRQER